MTAERPDESAPARLLDTTLTESALRRFLAEAHGHPLEALFTLAMTTGMRQGQLLGLRWRDIDWATRRAFVRHTLVRLHGRWWLGEPKTARSERSIELTDATHDLLRAHRDRQAEVVATAGRRLTGDDLVSPTRPVSRRGAATSRPSGSRRYCAVPGCPRSASTTCATPSPR